MLELVLMSAMICSVVLLVIAAIVVMTSSSKKKQPTAKPATATIPQDQPVTITNPQNGKPLGLALHPDNAANMCDLTYPSATAGQFMISQASEKSAYAIKANCDGDGKFTSSLAENATDLIQPKRTASNETWRITCPSATAGCTIQGSKTKKYLAASPTGPTLSTNKAYWKLR